jgi:uncharacterized paraquat-inducible protein A
MTLARELKKCPACNETISNAATRCHHCHTDLPRKKSWWAKIDNFRTGFLSGILFTLIVGLLVYLHFLGDI